MNVQKEQENNIMKCPECNCEESKVIDSRPTENKVRRRRECIQCGYRFTTYEIIEEIPLMVIKKDNSIEPFDREKLVDKVCRAAVKRPVNLETIENMVEEIATELLCHHGTLGGYRIEGVTVLVYAVLADQLAIQHFVKGLGKIQVHDIVVLHNHVVDGYEIQRIIDITHEIEHENFDVVHASDG